MKILHLLSGGGIGGIEVLCRDIAQLSREQHEFCFLYSGGVIAEEMQKEGVPVYLYFENNLPARMYKLWKLVKRQQYDIIMVHHEGIGIYSFYLMLTYCFPQIKYVKYLHCSFEEKYFYQGNLIKDKLNYYMLKKALLRSNSAIAVSEFVKKSYCKEFDYDADSVKVLYNGIKNVDILEEKKEKVIRNERIGLLYIGRLIEVKGVHLLLHAVQKLTEHGENVFLEVLGDGPQKVAYEQLAEELGISEIVYFRGKQLDKQDYYDKTQIFIYPSVWQEAFGISIVEALAQGMICVASNSGGIPEIITDGEDGFLFECGDVDALTETLFNVIQLCKNEEKKKILALKAASRAKAFNIDKMVADLKHLCDDLLMGTK